MQALAATEFWTRASLESGDECVPSSCGECQLAKLLRPLLASHGGSRRPPEVACPDPEWMLEVEKLSQTCALLTRGSCGCEIGDDIRENAHVLLLFRSQL